MAQIDLGSYKNIYLKTAKEYVNSMLEGCGKLVSDSQNKEAINQVHISSHSLKSQSQVMKFENIAGLSAIIEKISSEVLERGNKINDDLVVALKESAQALNLCLSQIEKENKEKDLNFMVKRLENYIK